MFGSYRTLLAMMVVLQHLGGVNLLGVYAVFGFYVLSGYLMTLIMQQRYGYSAGGMGRFALTRFLRLFPEYWAACVISILILLAIPSDISHSFTKVLYLPSAVEDWLRNAFLFFPGLERPRLSPPTWALTVEIFFYICIAFGATRNIGLTITAVFVGAAYHAHMLYLDLHWSHRYFTIAAGALPFAVGSLIYYLQQFSRSWLERMPLWLPLVLVIAFLANWALAWKTGSLLGYPYYINVLLVAACIWSMSNLHRRLGKKWQELDTMIGNYSYPVYLIHYQLGLLTIAVFGIESQGASLFFLSLVPLFVLSFAMIRWVEQPVENLRGRIRPKTAPSG